MAVGIWKLREEKKKQKLQAEHGAEEDNDGPAGKGEGRADQDLDAAAADADDPSAVYRNLLTGRHFRKRRYFSREGMRNDEEIRREVLGEADDAPWRRSGWLGLGLFLILCPFWMLDSLKDPVFADLVDGNLERHQPTAKLFSVVATLLLVCAIEITSSAQKRKTQRGRRRRPTELGWKPQDENGMEFGPDGRISIQYRDQMRELPHEYGEQEQEQPQRQDKSIEMAWSGGSDCDGSDDRNGEKGPEVEQPRPISDVLDPGGRWTRMSLESSAERDEAMKRKDQGRQNNVVNASIFARIGISYGVIFLFLMNMLQQHEAISEEGDIQPIRVGNDKFSFDFKPWYVLAYVFYAAIESFGSLAVAAFWSFCNSTLSLHQAERYYGTIVALAQLGAIQGSTLVASNAWSAPTLVLVACLFMMLQILVMRGYCRHFLPTSRNQSLDDEDDSSVPDDCDGEESSQQHRSALSPAAWSGIRLILQHKYVMLILGVSCLYEVSLTCLDYQMKLLGYDRFGGDAMSEVVAGYFDGSNSAVVVPKPESELGTISFSQFMGRYGQAVNLTSLVLSSMAFPWLIRTIGLRWMLRLFPTLLLIATFIAFGALPGNLAVLVASLSILKAMTYSIHDPAKELLYLPTSLDIQFRAKFWIDVVGARVSKAAGSAINTYAGSVDRIIRVGTVPSVLTAAGLWLACYLVGRQFDELQASGKIVGAEDSPKRASHHPAEYDADEASDGSRGADHSDRA